MLVPMEVDQSGSANLCKIFRRISEVWENALTLNLEKCLLYQSPIASQFLGFIQWSVHSNISVFLLREDCVTVQAKNKASSHVSEYFWIRNFFFLDTASVYTHPVNSTAYPLFCKFTHQFGSKKTLNFSGPCRRVRPAKLTNHSACTNLEI